MGAPAAAAQSCKQLLQRAVAAVAGTNGAVFAVERDGGLDPVIALHDPEAWLSGPLGQTARTLLRDRDCGSAGAAVRLPGQAVPSECGPYLCVPLELERELVGVLVVAGVPAQAATPAAELHQLGELPELIAFSLDRVRMVAALDQREQQLGAERSRLDATLVESRSDYQKGAGPLPTARRLLGRTSGRPTKQPCAPWPWPSKPRKTVAEGTCTG